MNGTGGAEMMGIGLACGALLVRAGLGWYGTGLARAKNAAGAVLRNVADLAIATLAFWAVGGAILNYAGSPVFGLRPGQLFDLNGETSPNLFLQIVLVLIATAPISSAVAERCRFFPILAASALMAAVIVPVAGHWAWGGAVIGAVTGCGSSVGWLRRLGFFDAAGASVLHVTGGLCALAAAIIARPRTGKYNRDGSSNMIPGHSMPMASVGVMLMLIGWVPYVLAASMMNGGFSSRTAVNVLLAASAGALVAVLLSHARYGKPDVMLTYGGLLGALVAISGATGEVSTLSAVVIGAIAGLIVPTITVMLDLIWKIDDPGGGVAIHAFGGAWGTIAVGIFAPTATYGEMIKQIGVQVLGLVVIGSFALLLSTILFLTLRATVGLRLSEAAEFDGADLAEHDLNAYPDFQQTMIKSYHLRET